MSTDLLKKEETILNNNNNILQRILRRNYPRLCMGSELIKAFLYPPYKRLHQISPDLEKPELDYQDFIQLKYLYSSMFRLYFYKI